MSTKYMGTEYDTSDPLGLLMFEWAQIATWFWMFLAAAAVVAFAAPPFAMLVAIAALGFVVLKLGHTIVIVGNELRKEVVRPPRDADVD